MVRIIVSIISFISFLAGVIGWIATPDDARMWLKKLSPVFAAMGKDDLILVLFGISALGIASIVFGPKVRFLAHGFGTTAIKLGRLFVTSENSNEFMEIRHDSSYENIVIISCAPEGRRVRKRCFVGVKNMTSDKILKRVRLTVTEVSDLNDFESLDLKSQNGNEREVELFPGQEKRFQVIDQIITNNVGAAVTIGDDEKWQAYWFPDKRQITLVASSDSETRTKRFWVEPNLSNEARLVNRKRITSLIQRAWPR